MSTNATEYTEVSISEWERLSDLFESFCTGYFDADETTLTCRSGGASITVTRRGDVDARMPLHSFSTEGVERLAVDVDGGSLRVETGAVRYEFRQP